MLTINRDPRLESLGYFQSSADADERYASAKVRNAKAWGTAPGNLTLSTA